jgi:hypothetical protein
MMKVGDHCWVDANLGTFQELRGELVKLTKPRKLHEGIDEDGNTITIDGFGCRTGAGRNILIAHDFLIPLLVPTRGDMDTKVSWADMPYKKRDEDLL